MSANHSPMDTQIQTYDLETPEGFKVQILSLGAIITQIMAKDRNQHRKNVVLRYDNLNDYASNPFFLGCVVGPVAGRTKDGIIEIPPHQDHQTDEKNILTLDTSIHPNALHSGEAGLHLVHWNLVYQSADTLVLSHKATLNDAYKTKVTYNITYTVSNETLAIDYHATSDHPTYLSLTNHSYFNLTGEPLSSQNGPNDVLIGKTIQDHHLKLACSHYIALDADSLPKALIPLSGSDLDFTTSKRIGDVIANGTPTVLATSGVDHPFRRGYSHDVALLLDPESGRQLKVITTQPYAVIYTGNFLHGTGHSLHTSFGQYAGICFETQDLPDVVNNHLDEVHYVTPESPYVHRTAFDFSIG